MKNRVLVARNGGQRKNDFGYKVILSSKWKIDLGQYEQTTKFAKRQYSDIPSNGTCSMPNHYCLICGKSFFDSKALNLHISRTHMTSILQILRDDPMNTYKAIFGSENFKAEFVSDKVAKWVEDIKELSKKYQGRLRRSKCRCTRRPPSSA